MLTEDEKFIEEFNRWFNKNHPFDWWAKERTGKPLPHHDRLRVRFFAQKAYIAGVRAYAMRVREQP